MSLKNLKAKRNRLTTVIKVRKIEFDKELLLLNQVRQEKLQRLAVLKENQRKYIDGVDDLNRMRNDCDLSRLQLLESSLDFVKHKWQEALSAFREAEVAEKHQVRVVLKAQQDLKSVEKISERYETEMTHLASKTEQKAMDELAMLSEANQKHN
jgi:flagellar biosynthesis chaperone FliJ